MQNRNQIPVLHKIARPFSLVRGDMLNVLSHDSGVSRAPPSVNTAGALFFRVSLSESGWSG